MWNGFQGKSIGNGLASANKVDHPVRLGQMNVRPPFGLFYFRFLHYRHVQKSMVYLVIACENPLSL